MKIKITQNIKKFVIDFKNSVYVTFDYKLVVLMIVGILICGIIFYEDLYKSQIFHIGIFGVLGFLSIRGCHKILYYDVDQQFLLIIVEFLVLVFWGCLLLIQKEHKEEHIVLFCKRLIREKALVKGNIVIWKPKNSLLYIFCLLQECRNKLNIIHSNLIIYAVNYSIILAPQYSLGYQILQPDFRIPKYSFCYQILHPDFRIPKYSFCYQILHPDFRMPKAITKNKTVFIHKITLGSIAIKGIVVNKDKRCTFVYNLALLFLLLLNNNTPKITGKKDWFFGDKLQIIGNNNISYTAIRFYPGGGDKKVIAELGNLGKNVAGAIPPYNITSKQQLTSGTPQPAEVTNSEKDAIITPKKPDEIQSQKASITPSDNQQEISTPVVKSFYDPMIHAINNTHQVLQNALENNERNDVISVTKDVSATSILEKFKADRERQAGLENLAKSGLPENCRFSLTQEERGKALEQATIDAIPKSKQIEFPEELTFLGLGKRPEFEEHYRHLLATIKLLKKYPEDSSAICLLQIYGRLWANLNIQTLQAASKQLIFAKMLKRTQDFLKYVKKPEKYEKELSEVLIRDPNTIDELMALTKLPLNLDLRYCNADKKAKILEAIQTKFGTNFRNNTNNQNPDTVLIYNNKAVALDIKRLSSNYTSLGFDEIHNVARESLITKTQIVVKKLLETLENNTNVKNKPKKLQKKLLEGKEKEQKRKLTEEEKDKLFDKEKKQEILTDEEQAITDSFIAELEKLQKNLYQNPTETLVGVYNELIVQHLDLLDKLKIRITVLTTTDITDFNLPNHLVVEHQKNYDNPENIAKVTQLLEDEKNTEQKALTYTTKTVVRGLIEYVKNSDDK